MLRAWVWTSLLIKAKRTVLNLSPLAVVWRLYRVLKDKTLDQVHITPIKTHQNLEVKQAIPARSNKVSNVLESASIANAIKGQKQMGQSVGDFLTHASTTPVPN